MLFRGVRVQGPCTLNSVFDQSDMLMFTTQANFILCVLIFSPLK